MFKRLDLRIVITLSFYLACTLAKAESPSPDINSGQIVNHIHFVNNGQINYFDRANASEPVEASLLRITQETASISGETEKTVTSKELFKNLLQIFAEEERSTIQSLETFYSKKCPPIMLFTKTEGAFTHYVSLAHDSRALPKANMEEILEDTKDFFSAGEALNALVTVMTFVENKPKAPPFTIGSSNFYLDNANPKIAQDWSDRLVTKGYKRMVSRKHARPFLEMIQQRCAMDYSMYADYDYHGPSKSVCEKLAKL